MGTYNNDNHNNDDNGTANYYVHLDDDVVVYDNGTANHYHDYSPPNYHDHICTGDDNCPSNYNDDHRRSHHNDNRSPNHLFDQFYNEFNDLYNHHNDNAPTASAIDYVNNHDYDSPPNNDDLYDDHYFLNFHDGAVNDYHLVNKHHNYD